MKGIAFKDRVLVYAYAGNGGNGCAAFRREKFVPLGGPDGGDGGHGGDVLLVASKDVDSLNTLYFQPHQRAQHGGRGSGAQRTGETGKPLHILVPCGTEVWAVRGMSGPSVAGHLTEEAEDVGTRGAIFSAPRDFLGEVVRDGDQLLVAKGGHGGRGNQHYATPSHQAPREHTLGTAGEVKTLILELKVVADVGLVGYPNAGKSTLLRALTSAHPKVAPYPFTTLNPQIGTLPFDDYTSLRIADIPGLIDGAHEGVGLGHDFLRHIERSGFLLFVIDMAGSDGRKPIDDYRSLRNELRLHLETLEHRPRLIVANKMDLPGARRRIAAFKRATGEEVLPISAETGEGIEELKQFLHDWRRGRRHVPEPGS